MDISIIASSFLFVQLIDFSWLNHVESQRNITANTGDGDNRGWDLFGCIIHVPSFPPVFPSFSMFHPFFHPFFYGDFHRIMEKSNRQRPTPADALPPKGVLLRWENRTTHGKSHGKSWEKSPGLGCRRLHHVTNFVISVAGAATPLPSQEW